MHFFPIHGAKVQKKLNPSKSFFFLCCGSRNRVTFFKNVAIYKGLSCCKKCNALIIMKLYRISYATSI